MEDNPNSFQMEDDINFVLVNHGSLFSECNLVLTQLDHNGGQPHFFLQLVGNLSLIFLKIFIFIFFSEMEDNLHIFVNGIQPLN